MQSICRHIVLIHRLLNEMTDIVEPSPQDTNGTRLGEQSGDQDNNAASTNIVEPTRDTDGARSGEQSDHRDNNAASMIGDTDNVTNNIHNNLIDVTKLSARQQQQLGHQLFKAQKDAKPTNCKCKDIHYKWLEWSKRSLQEASIQE